MKTPESKSNTRIFIIILICVIITGAFGIRLMQMQIVDGADYLEQSQKRTISTMPVKAARGEIVDRYGRPFAINRRGFNIIIDKAFMPRGMENELILKLTSLLTIRGEEWNDSLPISKDIPFSFLEGRDNDIQRLKKNLRLNDYAPVENVMDAMIEKYKLTELSPDEVRTVAGVRYEMERTGFSISNQYTFAEDVSMETSVIVSENRFDLPGVDIIENPIREYVSQDVAAHIIGFTGPIYAEEYAGLKDKGYRMNDIVGKDGIEKAFEKYLRGTDGERKIETNARGDVVDIADTEYARSGNTIMLTIDREFQRFIQEETVKQISWLNEHAKEMEGKEANAASVVVLDTRDFSVLASVTVPYYNLAEYKSQYNELIANPLNPLFNRATSGLYAPGSCYKPAVALAGIADGLIRASTTFECRQEYTEYPDLTFSCMGYHGRINVLDSLRVSCNIFFYEIGRLIGIDNINYYAGKLGLGNKTGIELEEQAGMLSNPGFKQSRGELWQPGDLIQSAIGQSDTLLTPMQLATYAATIANKGVRYRTHLVQSVKTYNQDEFIMETAPEIADTLGSDDDTAIKAVIEGMVAASRQGTVADTFGAYPLDVASKTGTPQISGGFTNAAFIAFAPAYDPQIAVAIIIERGGHGYFAAPLAKKIFDRYFFEKETADTLPSPGQLLD